LTTDCWSGINRTAACCGETWRFRATCST
jgi:hypothetical protein